MMPFTFYKDDSGFSVDPGLQVAKTGAGKPVRRNAGEKQSLASRQVLKATVAWGWGGESSEEGEEKLSWISFGGSWQKVWEEKQKSY